jgi:hypothetical protein
MTEQPTPPGMNEAGRKLLEDTRQRLMAMTTQDYTLEVLRVHDTPPEAWTVMDGAVAIVANEKKRGLDASIGGKLVHLHWYFTSARALLKAAKQTKGQEDTIVHVAIAYVFVVAEGFAEELGLTHPLVTPLLQQQEYRTIKRFRNTIFHFQPKMCGKFLGAFDISVLEWVGKVITAFEAFFKQHLPPVRPRSSIGDIITTISRTLPGSALEPARTQFADTIREVMRIDEGDLSQHLALRTTQEEQDAIIWGFIRKAGCTSGDDPFALLRALSQLAKGN